MIDNRGKKTILLLFYLSFLLFSTQLFSQNTFFSDADIFFKKYVINGKVNYQTLHNSPAEVNRLVNQIATYPLTDETGNTNKAFYINAYNLMVIKQVIDHYPVTSPRDIAGFFETNKYEVALSLKTLNQIENEILRFVYPDPRMHFVLVCGALGCPVITNFAYMPDQLDDQLENQTRLALNDPGFIRLSKEKTEISEIFKWYEMDFVKPGQSVVDFINLYRTTKIEKNAPVEFYNYDWSLNEHKVPSVIANNTQNIETSNIFTYTPSKLLKKGEIEMQLFNNIYSQTAYRDGKRDKVEQEGRSTYYSGLFYLLFGQSKSGRVNVGFDINIKAVYIDENRKGNPLAVFRFETSPSSRTALTSLGPKIKFQPFKNFSNFSVQSAFWMPVAKDLEAVGGFLEYPWMDYDMYTWWNQFFFDKTFGTQWQIFTEADLLFKFKKKDGGTPTHFDIPLSFFLSWFPSQKTTLYTMLQYSPRLQLEPSEAFDWETQMNYTIDPFDLVSDYAQSGLGIKYQVSNNLNLEASYTYFFTSKNGGAGSTYNLGLRIIL
ncbi:MAG: DUF547 domain-containing protein [Bacteroidales bacterium]|nr:DUF547 domain-containing protein [Bacteroidales bacterium]MCF8404860.1 DUF547 domain-containing protein [Bacteroidales bacterium]